MAKKADHRVSGAADQLALLQVEEMGEADAAAIAGGVPGIELMENAGRAVADVIQARWNSCPVLVCCGPGNNGGDGFVAARHLAGAGWPVRLALLGERSALKGDAAHHATLWQGSVLALEPALLEGSQLVVDALFGAGLNRPVEGAARALLEQRNEAGLPLVAVDVPSGLSGDSGAPLGGFCARAALTVTFFRKKPGHLLLPGRARCGEVAVFDIGIPDAVLDGIAPQAWENGPALWSARYPRRRLEDHKYRFGHALVLGGATMTGAARLAARAALRVGAGLVTLACPREALAIYAQDTASVITQPLDRDSDFTDLLDDPRRNVVLLGPGSGATGTTRHRVLETLDAGKVTVLDADALTAFQDAPDSLFHAAKPAAVLTPHEGEFARLFPDLEGDKLTRTRAAAKLSGSVVLLKGADTVIARPDGAAAINANAPPELATAGAGDVLAGLIAGLLAQGMAPFDAACAGAWLHGAAATCLGLGMIADDLPDSIPKALRSLPNY